MQILLHTGSEIGARFGEARDEEEKYYSEHGVAGKDAGSWRH